MYNGLRNYDSTHRRHESASTQTNNAKSFKEEVEAEDMVKQSNIICLMAILGQYFCTMSHSVLSTMMGNVFF